MARPVEINREQALNKAMELFWVKGYEASSVQQLLDVMGMNRGSMYSAFGDKRALFVASLELYADAISFMVDEVLRKPDDPVDAIKAFFRASISDVDRDIVQRGCMIVNTITEEAKNDDELVMLAANKQRIVFDALEDRIRQGQQSEQVSVQESPADLANFLLNTIQGLRVSGRVPGNDASHEESVIRIALGALGIK